MGEEYRFKLLVAKVTSISEHKNAPSTIELERKFFLFKVKDAVTIDSRCTFYKGDKVPKTVDIIECGDNIKIEYINNENVKVAFNIVVL